MKYDVNEIICFCSTSMELPVTANDQTEQDELNLEELIKYVSIGKSAVDPKSGKCKIIEKNVELKEARMSTDGSFNPLTHVTSASSRELSCKLQNRSNKKCRQEKTDHEKYTVNDEIVLSKSQTTDKTLEVSSTERLKRKRHLLDTESFCLNKTNDKNNKQNDKSVVSSNDIPEVDEDTSKPVAKLSSRSDENLKDFENISSSSYETSDTASVVVTSGAPPVPDLEQLSIEEGGGHQLPTCQVQLVDVSLEKDPSEVTPTKQNIELTQSKSPQNEENQAKKNQKRKLQNSNETETRTLPKRIRKTLPPLKTRQTPLGLPKPLRIKKSKFSVEEIYTNKNYSTPVPKQLETIFEYPKEGKDGAVRLSDKKRKQRAMYFCTNPADRPTKKRTKYKKRSTRRSKRDNDAAVDTRLIQTLADLDQHLLIHDLSP